MKRINIAIILFLFLTGIFTVGLSALVLAQAVSESHSVDLTGLVPGCGDNLIEPPEQCDGSDLGGATCVSQGFRGGTLACNSFCNFSTYGCTPGQGTAHYVCDYGSKQCLQAPGGGLDECKQDDFSTCIHSECDYSAHKCVSKDAPGANQCQNDNECICSPKGDINLDGLVDITDFSILMYNWSMPLDWNQTPPVLPPYTQPPYNKCADISHFVPPYEVSGIVDFQDFSIMLYWWSGT